MSIKSSTKEILKERGINNVSPITKDDTFEYSCSCCGKCCTNRTGKDTIVLSMYDIYNLAKGLKLTTKEFITKYASVNIGPNSGLSVIGLKNVDTFQPGPLSIKIPTGSKCIFLTYKEGKQICGVNDFKPGVCRIFPLGRVTSTEEREIMYILQESDCQLGIKKKEKHKLHEWIPNIELSEKAFDYNRILFRKVDEVINLPKAFNSELIENHYKDMLAVGGLEYLYGAFDPEKDFFEQVDSVIDGYIDFLKIMVSILIHSDESVTGKEFSDFHDKNDALMNLIRLFI